MKKIGLSILSGFLIANSSYAILPAHLIDAVYTWPEPVWNVDVNLTIINDPGPSSTYFWFHFFDFANNLGLTPNRAGYAGLQTTGKGKQALFSIWNALDAQGANCSTFGGEGTGFHCKISYHFVPGGSYRIRVWQLTSDSTGDWWVAWVKDNKTNNERTIGYIKSPPNSGLIVKSFLVDEYFTDVPSCSSMAFAKVGFSTLTGNTGGVTPLFSRTAIGAPCANFTFDNFTGKDFTVSSPTLN